MSQKNFPNSKQFFQNIKKGITHNIYLFAGEAEGDKDKAINALLSMLFQSEEDKNNNTGKFFIFEDRSSDDEILAAVDFALSFSMFSPKKACIIRNLDNIKTNDKNKKLIKELTEELPESTMLIITISSKDVPSYLSHIPESKMAVFQFWKQFDSDLINYIKVETKNKKIPIEEKFIYLILELAGNDIKKIDTILDMVQYLSLSKDIEITESLIRDLAGDIKDVTIFDFTDSLFLKEKRSLTILKKLLNEGTETLFIINMIIRQLEFLDKYFLLIKSGLAEDEVLKKIGIQGKLKKEKFIDSTRLFNDEKIKTIFAIAAKAEYLAKSGSAKTNLLSNPAFILSTEILMLK